MTIKKGPGTIENEENAAQQLKRVRGQLLLEKAAAFVFEFPDFRLEVIQKAM